MDTTPQSHQTSEGEIKEESEVKIDLQNMTSKERWTAKKETDAFEHLTNNNTTNHWLRRQCRGKTNATITGCLGGSTQIPNAAPSQKSINERQTPLVKDNSLDRKEPLSICVNRQLHPTCPGHQTGVLKAKYGTVNLDVEAILKEAKVRSDHPFPLFIGNGCDGNWLYEGHYVWVKDTDVNNEGLLDNILDIGNNRFKDMLQSHPDAADKWINVLADKDKNWSISLNRYQRDYKAATMNNGWASVPDNMLNSKEPRDAAIQFLRDNKMIEEKSGTEKQRQDAVRAFMLSGEIKIKYAWLKFEYFDEKFNTCMQERASGKNATKRQIWEKGGSGSSSSSKKKKRQSQSFASNGKSKKRSRRRSGAVLVRPVKVKWPDDKGVYEKYSGDLFEYKDDKAKYIQFEIEKNKKYDINEMKNENVKGADVKFKKNIVDPTLEDEWFKMLYK